MPPVPDRCTPGPQGQRGTALVLLPAATLVLVVLGALSVDTSTVLMEQRHLVTTAEAATGDAAARGVDLADLRRSGVVAYDDRAIDAAISRSVHGQEPRATIRWRRTGAVIEVWLRKPVDLVFSPRIRGGSRQQWITAHASAELVVR